MNREALTTCPDCEELTPWCTCRDEALDRWEWEKDQAIIDSYYDAA